MLCSASFLAVRFFSSTPYFLGGCGLGGGKIVGDAFSFLGGGGAGRAGCGFSLLIF
jgi:hypothetical protein